VTGLVFCCVWGVFAQQKLLDAIKNGDLNTVKAQIELLDVDPSTVFRYSIDVWGQLAEKNSQYYSGLSRYDQNYFNREFYEQSDKYKAIIQYLLEKGAKVSDKFIQEWMDKSDGGKCIEILKYMLENKIIDLNRSFTFGYYNYGNKYDMDEHYSTAAISNYYYGLGIRKDNDKGWFEKFLLISEYAAVPSEYMETYNFAELLFGDIAGVKSLIRNGKIPVGATQLFIRNKDVIELLKATDNYKLDNFKGYITPYYVGTIIPKYCTQCLTADEIGIIKLIADYDVFQPRDAAIEKVKAYIDSGVDFKKKQYVLGGATIGELPKMIGKFGGDDIIGIFAYRKAKQEKMERERKAEEDLMSKYLPKFSDNVREILMEYGTVKKGVYKVKNKEFENLAQKKSLYEVYLIRMSRNETKVYIERETSERKEKLYQFLISDGYTLEMVQKVWNTAVDQVCDEFGIQ
jgi:SOS response regulatory protein OraA/RecX